jgi:hypothetical protein
MQKLYTLFLFCAPILSFAQKTSPAPYCVSAFNNNYNMMKEISAPAYTHSFGSLGSLTATNTYLYVDTAHLPIISKSTPTNYFLDFYSVPDAEPAYFGVWIDYNHNNTFDTSELVFYNENTLHDKLPFGSASDISLPLPFLAPMSAKNGITRMRIVRSQNPTNPTGPYNPLFKLSPCHTPVVSANVYGCTYDFDVIIESLTGIEEQMLRSQLTVVPNPATDKLNIFNTSAQKISNLTVLDFSGKMIAEMPSASTINIADYASGIYFVRITMENGLVLPIKFVKQ